MNLNKVRPAVRWLLFISCYLAMSLLHLRFSLFLDRPLPGLSGNIRPIVLVEPFLKGLLALLALAVLCQMLKYPWRRALVFFWTIWIFSVALADRFLLFKSVEYLHYPQYGLLAALLIWCLDPGLNKVQVGRVLFWAVVFGIFDELYQYAHLAKSYGDYLDFNDFFLNLQGAAAGVLLVYGFSGRAADAATEREGGAGRSAAPTLFGNRTKGIGGGIELGFVMAALVMVVFLGASGRIRLSPEKIVPPGGMDSLNGRKIFYLERKPGMMGRWNGGIRRPLYYVLGPGEGFLLLLGTGLVFSSFGAVRRRWKDCRF